MPLYELNSELFFPETEQFGDDGLVAIGGDLSPERLLLAYQRGIFPWCSPEDPLLWWSPDPRAILTLDRFKVSKSLRNILNRGTFTVTFDRAFEDVMHCCADREEEGTWISDDFIQGYNALHQLGFAHSVESWKDGELVGGLYGVSIGGIYFGESMFSKVSNASKVALVHLVDGLKNLDFRVIDCQLMNDHLASLGAEHMAREVFLIELDRAMGCDTVRGNWGEIPAFSKASTKSKAPSNNDDASS